jgi:homoserine kinase
MTGSIIGPARTNAAKDSGRGWSPGSAAARLRPGVTATVRVPATSANLGPGYDSMGLALGVHDVVQLTPRPSGIEVEVDGEGAGGVPLDETHLVIKAIRAAYDHVGVPQPGLLLHCRNTIPHGRGLGSSAAAVVAGLVAARGTLDDPSILDDDTLLKLATDFEGHPDNAAAALLGGFTVCWLDAQYIPHAVRLDVRADLDPVVCVPGFALATSAARAMLPAAVPHADAAFNAARAALLVHAMTSQPGLLMEATQDRLHQAQRAPAMPQTAALVAQVRAEGAAAVVSGAGPSVLVLGIGDAPADAVTRALAGAAVRGQDWQVFRPGIDTTGALVATEGD